MASYYRFGSSLSILYVAFRVSTANLAPITDCDEVFNYWEPLHFVLYGTGMQTWEYAPQFALRTYAYLLPMAAAAKPIQFLLGRLPPSWMQQLSALLLLTPATTATTATTLLSGLRHENKPLLFAMLRSLLALVSSYSELSFLDAVSENTAISGRIDVAHWTALVGLTAAGNFHSGQAFLPSSSVMILWRLSASNQLRENHAFAILWGLVAVLAAGWPFCAVLFLSTGLWAVWDAGRGGGDAVVVGSRRERTGGQLRLGSVLRLLLRTFLHACIVQALVVAVDYHFYGRVVSPIWNIFAYNAQSGGDELYGVEPLSYYIKNLLLNFNLVGVLGVVSLPVIISKRMAEIFLPHMFDKDHKSNDDGGMVMLMLVPMYIWLAIVLPRPHKEERFLFPIYPMLCFGAAITMREILGLLTKLFSLTSPERGQKREPRNHARVLLGVAVLFPSVAISISRSFALHHNYSAPLDVYRDLFSHASLASSTSAVAAAGNERITYVCTAGEWYRFPSSFFLPPNHQLGFLKSSFTGQLPQPFTEFGSREESLDVQAGKFNDMNKEEVDRYVDISQCSYVVELVPSGSNSLQDPPECLQYMESDSSPGSWTLVSSREYLDAESTQLLHRILYLPFNREVTFKEYNLYAKER